MNGFSGNGFTASGFTVNDDLRPAILAVLGFVGFAGETEPGKQSGHPNEVSAPVASGWAPGLDRRCWGVLGFLGLVGVIFVFFHFSCEQIVGWLPPMGDRPDRPGRATRPATATVSVLSVLTFVLVFFF